MFRDSSTASVCMALLIAEPLTDAMPEGVTISASVSNNYTAFGKCLMDAILHMGF